MISCTPQSLDLSLTCTHTDAYRHTHRHNVRHTHTHTHTQINTSRQSESCTLSTSPSPTHCWPVENGVIVICDPVFSSNRMYSLHTNEFSYRQVPIVGQWRTVLLYLRSVICCLKAHSYAPYVQHVPEKNICSIIFFICDLLIVV